MTEIMMPVSPGELLDKITILRIKRARMDDPAKLANVGVECDTLEAVLAKTIVMTDEISTLVARLQAVNTALWDIEDDIRACERRGDFGETFIALARSVYRQNDQRAAVKREINQRLGSQLVEEKSYQPYD